MYVTTLLARSLKTFLAALLCFTFVNSYSQNEYRIQVSPNNQPKLKLSNLTEGVNIQSRHIVDSLFVIRSHENYTEQDFENIAAGLDFDIIYFDKTDRPLEPSANNVEKACCNITIYMADSYGDGWNGGELEVTINGVTTTHSVSSGYSAETSTLSYCDGQTLEISYTSGSWEGDNSYTISTAAGTLISDGPSPNTGLIFYSTNACSSTNPSPTAQDCEGAQMVCNNASFSGNSSGSGMFDELDASNDGCLSGENQSSWYYVNVGTSGTLEMTIDPANGSDDYDWAIWGPFDENTANANCSPNTQPIRCSFAGTSDPTGMGDYWGEYQVSSSGCGFLGLFACYDWGWLTPTENSEGSGGNGWVAPLNVQEDQVYILLIDNYSESNQPYDLTWGGSAGLDCTTVPLPVELISFEGINKADRNVLTWSTASEKNNDYFILQYSTDGVNWQDIEEINGAGTTSDEQYYSTLHRDFEHRINYYRLKQVDFNGTVKKHEIISIDNSNTKELLKRVNTLGQEVDENYKGIVIEYYKDGSIRKYFNN